MTKKSSLASPSPPAAPSPATYRRLALALPNAIESSHMGAPDFRIADAHTAGGPTGGPGGRPAGRIFATLAYGAKGLGTLKLTPEQQAAFLADAPEFFTPAPGAWGRMGATLVRLDAPEAVLAGALSTAYHHVLDKAAAKKGVRKGSPPAKAASSRNARLQ